MTMVGNTTSDDITELNALSRTELRERFKERFGRPAPKRMSQPL